MMLAFSLTAPVPPNSNPQFVISSMALLSIPSFFSRAGPSRYSTPPAYHFLQPSMHNQYSLLLKPNFSALCTSYEVGATFLAEEFGAQSGRLENPGPENGNLDSSQYEVILKGGEQVTSVLEEMAKLLEDMKMDEASEEVSVQLAAHGVIGKRVDEMESGFMMALDYMIQTAEKDQDDKRKSLLEVIKETVLSHLTKKCPPHVQVIGLLCRTPQKESRHELLRRVAAGGGVFQSENGTKVHLPGANLNDIANQADDILEMMESRSVVPDRKLLARLVLIREEARSMMGGGILDERNDRGLNTLPESEVNFLTKLVSLRPGKTVRDMIKNVMLGKEEGEDSSDDEVGASGGIAGRASVSGRKPLPVRPGMFLETVSKVLGGIYGGNVSGVTAQHLEWNANWLIVFDIFLTSSCSSEHTSNTSRDCILVVPCTTSQELPETKANISCLYISEAS